MRWLKSIVIVLGILIVLGIVLLGYGFYKKTSEPSWKPFAEKKKSIEEPQPALLKKQENTESFKFFGTLSLDLAEGCMITKIQPTRRYVYFMIGQRPACNSVVLVDIKKGLILGRIIPRP
jgi:hypothetical protein